MKQLLPIMITLVTGLSASANMQMIKKEMEAFQKPMVQQLKHTVENDPELSPEYKQYLAEVKQVQTIKESELKKKQLIAVNMKYKNLFERAMKKSKVDSTKSKKKAKELTAKYKGYNIEAYEFLSYIILHRNESQNETSPVETEVEFQPPFTDTHNADCPTLGGSLSVDLETGFMRASNVGGYVNSCARKAGLGMFLRVPWLNERIRVSTKLRSVDFFVQAIAGGAGVGAKASAVIDLRGEDGESCVKNEVIAEAIAPVFWFAQAEGTTTVPFACEMRSPGANEDLGIRFQHVADVTAVGNGIGEARVKGTAAPIRVRLIE